MSEHAPLVLVADDNAVDRLLLSRIVKNAGYRVVTAEDGLEAVAAFIEHSPDMVLLDALMPELDGFGAAKKIKAIAGDLFVPLIFLTSLTEADELARCIEAGGDDFLSKPYNSIILQAKLSALERLQSLNQTVREQRDEIASHNAHLMHEQEAAKAVFDSVAHTGCLNASNVQYLLSPLSVFNGDVLLAARSPGGSMYVLLGDFTGHGLTAAIGAMPLAEIFYGMTQKGFLLGEILRECNRKLKTILPPGYFCCATMVEINFHKEIIEYWAGGLPEGFLYRCENGEVDKLVSSHLPLGVLSPEKFNDQTSIMEMKIGDRLFLWTDGILEARNKDAELFGEERLERLFKKVTDSQDLFDNVLDSVNNHMGDEARDDDITLLAASMVAERDVSESLTPYMTSGHVGPEDWQLTYQLGPRSLKVFNPLPLLQHILMEVPQLRSHGGEIYTVLAELYSNALEHGLLGLDSQLKATAEGFADYYSKRALALDNLDGFVRFEFESVCHDEAGELEIRVVDSGSGFDYQTKMREDNNLVSGYHGRGLPLLKKLCQSLHYRGNGNEAVAVFEWSAP